VHSIIAWNNVHKVVEYVIGLLKVEKLGFLPLLCVHAVITELQLMAGKFGLTTKSRGNPSTP
jgi:hypothetical protein